MSVIGAGRHQCLTDRDQVNERQHVGDHLHRRGLTEGTDVDALTADRVEQVTMGGEPLVLTAHQHGDVT